MKTTFTFGFEKSPLTGRFRGVFLFLLFTLLSTLTAGAQEYDEEELVEEYHLYVFDAYVTSRNRDDILGDGKVSYDPRTQTLTLNEPRIYEEITVEDLYPVFSMNDACIYCEHDLTLAGVFHMPEDSKTAYGIYVKGDLKIENGDFTFYGSTCGVFTEREFSINYGTLRAIGGNYGLHSYSLSFYDYGNDVTKQYVELKGNEKAFDGQELWLPNEGFLLAKPEGGYIDSHQFFEADRTTIAKHVKFGRLYNIWLGDTQVSCANMDNILSQLDDNGQPTAKFDPNSQTLTLNNPTISSATNDCAIYVSGMDLTVEGSANINTTASCAIKLLDGELTLDGDFTFAGSDYAIWFNQTMKLGESSVITSPENAVFMDENTVKSDGTVAKSVTIVFTYKIWLGSTPVTPVNKNDIFGDGKANFDPSRERLILNNPTISGSKEGAKIYIDREVSITGDYHMSENDQTAYGLFAKKSVELDGHFTFYGSSCGVRADNNLVMFLSLKAIGGDYGLQSNWFAINAGLSIELKGTVMAYNCPESEFSYKTYIMLDEPEGGSFDENNLQFYETDGTTIAKHVKFRTSDLWGNIWLGNTPVTSANKDNIFDQLDENGQPTAMYDPTTRTLTLNNPTITGYDWEATINGRPSGGADKIYAEKIDLTIKGSYHMDREEIQHGIFMNHGSLTLDGDFSFFTTLSGILSDGDVTVKSGSLTAVGMSDWGIGYGIFANSLTIGADATYVDLQGENPLNLNGGGGLHLADGYAITTPQNGVFKNNVIYEADETTLAKSVVIQNATNPIQFYDLWVGGRHVTSLNQNDILGDGKASFDPATNTLTLQDNPTIPGTTLKSKIYSKLPSLTITGCYHMTEAETQNGIYSEGGPLTLNGDFTFLSKGDWLTDADGNTMLDTGNTLWVVGDITLNGNITVQGQDIAFSAIYTENGNINVQGGNLQASSNNTCAVWCGGTFTAKGSAERITLEGTPGAIHAGNLVIDNAEGQLLGCYEPKNAYFSEIWKSVYRKVDNTSNTGILATRVVLIQPRIYNLWLGSTQVTEGNCDDILNQKDANGNPTAIYDSETNTLTLNNPTISGTKNDCAIYAENMDLTVKGCANISTTASCAIKLFQGELTLDGNLTFEGKDYAIWFYPIMKLGQTIEITSPVDAVFMGENTVMSGDIAAKSVTVENVIKYKIWLGSTQVTGDNCNNILSDGKASFDPLTQTLTLDNPTISGTKNDCAIYAEWMDLTVKGSATVSTTASCAIKLLYGELTLDGDFTFAGSDYAIWFNRTMKLGQTTEITSPKNVDFMGGNTVVLKSDYSTVAKSVTMRKVENKYKIWLGETQVTSINKDDIFNDGRASYNPDTQTLTLNDPTINGTYSIGKIFIMDYDLTIKGRYIMNEAEESVGLYLSNCTLNLVGDFTFRGNMWGVESDRDITVKGNLNAIGTSTGIHFDNENCVLTLEHGFTTSRVEMSGGDLAMFGGSVSTDATLLIPEGGRVNRLGYIRTANDEIAKEAVLECRYANHGEGTEASPYMIRSKEDWNLLAEDIEAGASTHGIYFALVADIKVSKMLGTEQNPFSGTFNGYGCILTADINEDMQGVAPFHAISGATIKNLKVAGKIKGLGYSSGLVGYVKGNGNLIQNCEVTASIGASGGYNGGFVAHAGSYITTLDGCVFRGGFFDTSGYAMLNNGTFVGWDETGAQLTLTRCLDLTQGDPIGRGEAEPTTATNIYSTYDKSSITGDNAWTTAPKLAYKVTGADVNLTLTGATGATWNGYLYASQGETLSFTVNRLGVTFTSTAGTINQDEQDLSSYTLVMPAEDVTILNEYASSFSIAKADVTNGTAVVKDESRAGAVVGIHITPAAYYLLDEVTVTDDDNNEYEVEIDGEYGFFTMPNSDVTVSVTFKKQYSFENGVLHLLYGDFHIINRLAFDTDVIGHETEVLKVTADEGVRFTQSCSQLFKDFENCVEMDLSKVNTAGLVTTTEMFSGCTNLQKLNLTGWETRQIDFMNGMFEGCSNLRELDLSGFHVSSSTGTTRMFGTSGICKLTLPAGMAVTKEMELNKGYTYHNTYEGTWSNGTWSYSLWTVLGANGEVVSTVEADDNNSNFTYAVIPAPPVAMTFVWKHMPDDFILELPDGQDNSKTIADWNGITTSVQLTGRKLYKDGDWNTICLPFHLGPSEILNAFGTPEIQGLETLFTYNASGQTRWDEEIDTEEGYIYRTGFEEATGTLRLYFYNSDDIYSGEPFLIKWPKDTEHPYIESPTFTGVTIDISSDEANVSKTVTSEDGTVTFTGTYDPIAFTSENRSVLFLGTNNNLYYPDGSSTTNIGAFRAYFQLNGITAGDPNGSGATIKRTILNFGDGDATGVVSMEDVRGKMSDGWYDLSGRRLDGMPTAKGIYIVNGSKVVIK